jgi:hypothetical protein
MKNDRHWGPTPVAIRAPYIGPQQKRGSIQHSIKYRIRAYSPFGTVQTMGSTSHQQVRVGKIRVNRMHGSPDSRYARKEVIRIWYFLFT